MSPSPRGVGSTLIGVFFFGVGFKSDFYGVNLDFFMTTRTGLGFALDVKSNIPLISVFYPFFLFGDSFFLMGDSFFLIGVSFFLTGVSFFGVYDLDFFGVSFLVIDFLGVALLGVAFLGLAFFGEHALDGDTRTLPGGVTFLLGVFYFLHLAIEFGDFFVGGEEGEPRVDGVCFCYLGLVIINISNIHFL